MEQTCSHSLGALGTSHFQWLSSTPATPGPPSLLFVPFPRHGLFVLQRFVTEIPLWSGGGRRGNV